MQDKIHDIMTLIDGYAASDSISLRMLIESKLRELVREPLEVEYPDGITGINAEFIFAAGWHAAERAHGITSASGEV